MKPESPPLKGSQLLTENTTHSAESETPLTKHIYGLVETQEYGQAIQVLQTLLDSGRRERSVLSVLGFCHFKIQNYEAAAEIYAMLVEICPEVADYAFYLVQCLCTTNQNQKAYHICQEKLIGNGGPYESEAKQICANILYEDGQFNEALQVLQGSTITAEDTDVQSHEEVS